ncbi:CHASE2 domain-containing protein [Alkalinema sp. FACHB-956]|uniref:CHASE2 domain-containing protein n=1 Tax=Alkalinema sp. FACHB-956 TaxID=2692768 RepID=UPI00168854F7|nr:CHASE2 domain-containing protein [Alkalinema sp. FACHB-956]MBD2329142.1 CHASE2 domain-containing protein [Alkalinema sp. FACHB-956]
MGKGLKRQLGLWFKRGLPIVGISAGVIGLQWSGLLQPLEWAIWDLWLKTVPLEPNPQRVTVVAIDETDISRWGYPLSDELLAKGLTKIRKLQPRAIGLDLYRNLPVEPGHANLQQVFSTTPNLIGIQRFLRSPLGEGVDAPPILRDRKQVAASDLVIDGDGKVRRSLLSFLDTHKQPQLTLGTRLALIYLEKEKIAPKTIKGQTIQLGKSIFHRLEAHDSGYVQTNLDGYQIISRFQRSPGGVTRVSLSDVLDDKVSPDLLRNRVVLVGTRAPSINDQIYTPFSQGADTTWAGVEIHADVTNQLLSAALDGRQPLRGVPYPIYSLWTIVWIIGGGWVGWKLRSWTKAGFLLPGLFLVLVGTPYGLFLAGWWLPMAGSAIGFAVAGMFCRTYIAWEQLKRSHQMLANYSKQLEEEVAARTHELTEKNQSLALSQRQAEAANRAKSAFLANMNHELRTPLTIILGCSELLNYDPGLDAEQKSRLTTIERSVQHLLGLINDVLELSRLEAGAAVLRPTRFSLKQFLQGLEELFEPQVVAKGLTLYRKDAPDLPRYVIADENKLRQVLVNLINNAVKFTHQGTISLQVFQSAGTFAEASAQSESHPDRPATSHPTVHLIFQVSDTGVGIPAADLEQIFEAFVQSESGQQSQQGTGLGLAICRQMVQLMQGEITVTSTLGQGTQFQVTVPVGIDGLSPVDRLQSLDPLRGLAATSSPLVTAVQEEVQEAVQHSRAIAEQPSHWCSELHHAAYRLNAERCQRLIGEMPIPDPALLHHLETLICQFQFDKIVELTTLKQNQDTNW